MSLTLIRHLIRYRMLLVAITNAGLTWIVLIIAPLGLFAVITCTALVFVSSLATIWLGDIALDMLLVAGDRDTLHASRAVEALDPNQPVYPADRTLTSRYRRHLPR
jgi:hypothetical protein